MDEELDGIIGKLAGESRIVSMYDNSLQRARDYRIKVERDRSCGYCCSLGTNRLDEPIYKVRGCYEKGALDDACYNQSKERSYHKVNLDSFHRAFIVNKRYSIL